MDQAVGMDNSAKITLIVINYCKKNLVNYKNLIQDNFI